MNSDNRWPLEWTYENILFDAAEKFLETFPGTWSMEDHDSLFEAVEELRYTSWKAQNDQG